MAKKSATYDRLRKEQEQIAAYYAKIKEIEDRRKEREDQFALKVGKLVLKTLNSDVDELESFVEWLELYLLDKDEKGSESDSDASESVLGSDNNLESESGV